jgi:hypothetical protein
VLWTFNSSRRTAPLRSLDFIAVADIASTNRAGLAPRGFARHSPRHDQLSYQIIFFLHLLAEAIQFGFLIWTNAKVSFYWPATVGAKICGIRELKTTIQTISSHICPPYLSSAIVSDGSVGWGTSHATIQLSSCLGSFPLTKSIEDTSHCYITATRCTVTTTSHLLFAVSGSIPEPMGAGERDVLHHRIEEQPKLWMAYAPGVRRVAASCRSIVTLL